MTSCPYEDRVMDATGHGQLPADLVSHLEVCRGCSELLLVLNALGQAADFPEDDPLPDPRALWLRARVEQRRQATRRAIGAIVWVQRAALMIAAALVVAWGPVVLGFVRRAIGGMAAEGASTVPAAVASPIPVLAITALVLVALSALNGMGDPVA